MRKQIDYGTTVSAQGRNGRMKCIGLEVMTGDTLQMGPSFLPVVKFAPINTQGVGNCEIEVPLEQVPKLIQLLQRCLPLDELVGVAVRRAEEVEIEGPPGEWHPVATFPGAADLQLYNARWTNDYLIGTTRGDETVRIAEDNVLAVPYSRG
jgi:hypothetical protein